LLPNFVALSCEHTDYVVALAPATRDVKGFHRACFYATFPLLLIIMLSVMSSVGGTLGGLDLIELMYMFTFIALPVMATIYIIIIDLIQPKG